MAKVTITDTYLANIGQAIREKLGTSDVFRPSEMPGAIRAIHTEPNLDQLNVTQNGTYTPPTGTDGYDEVVVNVQGGGQSEFLKLEPIHTDIAGGYVGSGKWYYDGGTKYRTDVYEVETGKKYLIMLGATTGNRFRVAFLLTDPATVTTTVTGTMVRDIDNPPAYCIGIGTGTPIPFSAPSNGFIAIGKSNTNEDDIPSYVFEVMF